MKLSKLKKIFRDFEYLKGGFFFKRKDHLLFGYVVEKRGFGYVIWDFRYPLFDFRDAPNLLYSSIKDRSSFLLSGESENDNDTIRRLELFLNNLVECHNLEYSIFDFCQDIEDSVDKIEHPNISLSYAMAMILIDKHAEAEAFLLSSLRSVDGFYEERCNELLSLIRSEPEKAKKYVLELEEKMLRKILK